MLILQRQGARKREQPDRTKGARLLFVKERGINSTGNRRRDPLRQRLLWRYRSIERYPVAALPVVWQGPEIAPPEADSNHSGDVYCSRH
jgi:hypothetical protein